MMESIVEYSKALGKQADEYGESLDSKIRAAIENVTGDSSGNLTNASDSVIGKIKALKQKSEAFYQFAAEISNLLEVAQQTDQEVADAIAAQKDRFLDHHKSLRIENWKEKLLDLLVDFEISSALLALISKILNVLSDAFKSSKDAIKDWYKSAEAKAIRAGTPVGIAANGIPGWMPYGNVNFSGSKDGKGIDGLDLKDTILKWYEYPGIFADMAGNSGKGSTNTTTEKPEFTIGPATGDCVPVPDYPQLGSTAALVLGLDSVTGGKIVRTMNAVNALIGKTLITKEVINYNKKSTDNFAERYKMAQVVGVGAMVYAAVAGATEAAIMKAALEEMIKIPQGLTSEQFTNASKLIRQNVGGISEDIVVQGSRATGTAKANSDIDFAIRVSPEEFDALVKQRFGTPNIGSAKERTMLNSIETGKIQSGEAGLRGLRKQLQEMLGIDVDISIIKSGGAFDNGPTISLPQ